ncbi:MMPL family transporter [Fictibacillus sp. Mic-4]|uniref:MMPL family transporter n=1 Tax=Fictibacillus sp. Mic-4 TaxID=3132826 RepID=UPI003CF62BF1
MRGIIKARWLIVAVWVLVVALLVMTAPNMANLVREKGQIGVPDGYPSTDAQKLLNQMDEHKAKGESQVALVFHDHERLTKADLAEIKRGLDRLDHDRQRLGVSSILSHFHQKELKDQLVSKDGKTILVMLTVQKGKREPAEISKALYRELNDVKVDHYYTSSWMIDEDVMKSSQDGLKKTEYITVIFILAVLLIVFRSLIAPFIPLLTVGISYITAQSIVAFLVDKWDFPLSNFTQIFLVAVLFGIGTDYCILLLSRFKEEIGSHEHLHDAILATYKTAGKTVLFSGIAVMFGFAVIGLSTFKLYQSAVGVAVGIAILLLALVTIVPFFMAVLGKKLFWPAKKSIEHKPSRFWGAAGTFSFKRPLLTLLLVAAIVTPFLLTYNGQLSYNSLEEIGDSYNSVKAFNIIADSFGPGESLPTKIVVKNDEPMDHASYLATMEKISREVEKVNGVDTVRSATRPVGDELKELLVANQVKSLHKGLGKSNDGIKKISDGLEDARSKLSENEPKLKETTKGIGALVDGTDDLKTGVGAISGGLSNIEKAIREGSSGAGEMKKAVTEAKTGAQSLYENSQKLLQGYQQAGAGLSQLATHYEDAQKGIAKVSGALKSLTPHFANLEKNHKELAADQDYQMMKGTIMQLQSEVNRLSNGLAQLNQNLSKTSVGIKTANNGLTEVVNGQKKVSNGLGQLVKGLEQLESGLSKTAEGQSQVISKLPEVQNGLTRINNGQKQLQEGFGQLDGQMSQLTNGLKNSADGLHKVSGGLESANDYLKGLSSASDKELAGWYIPDVVLSNNDFQQVFNTYMSPDRKMATMDVIFKQNPYSSEALDKVDDIKAAIKRAVKGTNLENAQVGISGVTSMYSDLNDISTSDYTKTVAMMLIGIGVILVLLLRSVIMPLYILASLILTYYTAMSVSETIFVNILGYSGISWAVPFFGFVILLALGVDYSIFLMDRFNEYKGISVKEAMIESMKKMGTVIISAVIILGGTFAAMYPSGVLSMMQIATIFLTGVFLYAFVILPFFIPVMVKTFGKANWWPFARKEE